MSERHFELHTSPGPGSSDGIAAWVFVRHQDALRQVAAAIGKDPKLARVAALRKYREILTAHVQEVADAINEELGSDIANGRD